MDLSGIYNGQLRSNVRQAEESLTNWNKWQISLIVGLLFLLVSSPTLYRYVDMATRRVGDVAIATVGGRPNTWGLVLHALVFALLVRGLMELPRLNLALRR